MFLLATTVTVLLLPILPQILLAASAVKRLMFLMEPPICAAGAAASFHIKHQIIYAWLFISLISITDNNATASYLINSFVSTAVFSGKLI